MSVSYCKSMKLWGIIVIGQFLSPYKLFPTKQVVKREDHKESRESHPYGDGWERGKEVTHKCGLFSLSLIKEKI